MILEQREATLVSLGRVRQLRFPRSRKMPDVGSVIPITYRVPNPAIGFKDGEPKLEPIEKCRVRVTGVAHGWIHEITQQEAHVAGFRFRQDYIEDWCSRHRVASRQAPCWVLHVELHREHKPRFLSPVVIAGRQGDYTSDPHRAIEEAGEVPEDEYLEMWSNDARDALAAENESRRRDLLDLADGNVAAALAVIEQKAREKHVDVRSEVRAVRKFAERDPRVAIQQLERAIEKLLPAAA